MFCAHGLILGVTEGVGCHFRVLRSRTRFGRYRGRGVPFSCFALPDSFSTIPSTSSPVCIFCAPRHVFDITEGVVGTEDVGSRFHVLPSGTHFRWYRGRRGSSFHVLYSRTRFRRNRGRRSHFHVLRLRTRFQRYRGRRVLFSCFALPDSFSTVPWASSPIFMFYASKLVIGGTDGVRSRFHVLRPWTRFGRYRGLVFPFSCFTLSDSFGAVQRASGPIFMYCAPGLVLGVTEASSPVFMFCAPRLVLGGTEGVPFSCSVLPDSFLTVPRASGPVFMFCAPRPVLVDTEGARSSFHVLRSQTHLERY
jgi:hypothetical protein